MSVFWAFIGLYLAFILFFEFTVIKIVLFLSALLYLFLLKKQKYLILYLLFSLVGIGLVYLNRLKTPMIEVNGMGLVLLAKDNYLLVLIKGQRYYLKSFANNYEVGDLLFIQGKTQPLRLSFYESQFNFGRHLKSQGVEFEIFKANIHFKRHLLWPRRKMIANFLKHFPSQTSALIRLIFFDEGEYEENLIANLQSLGLVPLLSMSGVLIHTIPNFFEKLSKQFFPKVEFKRYRFLTLVPLFFLAFNHVVFLRIFISYMIIFFDNKQRLGAYNRLGLSYLFLGMINRYFLNSWSIAISLIVSLFFLQTENIFQKKGKTRAFLARQILLYAILLPFILYFQAGINLGGLIIYLPSVFIAQVIFLLSYFSFFTWPLVKTLTLMTNILNFLVNRIQIPFFFWPLGEFTSGAILLWFTLVFILIYGKIAQFKRFNQSLILLLPLLLAFQMVPLEIIYRQVVCFINVGQGDATLIVNKKTAILIDTGGEVSFDMAEKTLIPFFRRQKIHKLTSVMITHDDYDHSGALESLKKHFPVAKVITRPSAFPLMIGNMYFQNYNQTLSCSDNNDCSLVIGFKFKDKQWMIMGDAPQRVEEEIIAQYPTLRIDYLKVSHHGSKTGTSEIFIRQTKVREAIISCGVNNMYGHPHQEVLDILNKYQVKIRRTDLEGTIRYS